MDDRQYYLIPSDEDVPVKYRGELCCIGVLSKYEKYSFDMVRVNFQNYKNSKWNKYVISQSRLIPVTKEVADIMEGYKLENA